MAASRSMWVTEMMRASTATGSWPSSRSILRSCRKRSKCTWPSRQVTDFIEEQGAAIGFFHPADLALVRTRERTALIAEQLQLNQVIADRAAIDRNEWAFAARRALVDSHGRQFLAGPGFAGDEHVGVGVRDLADGAKELLHGLAGADHLLVAEHRRVSARSMSPRLTMPYA